MPVQLPLAGLCLPAPAAPISADLADLWAYPDLSTQTLCTHAKLLGHTGECLADSLLCRFGLLTIPLPELSSADRLVLHPARALRLQVKTTSSLRSGAWQFNIQKGYGHAPAGIRPYEAGAFDLLALVVLPENVVRFTAELRPRHRIARAEIATLRADPRASLEEALLTLGLATGLTVRVTTGLPGDLDAAPPGPAGTTISPPA